MSSQNQRLGRGLDALLGDRVNEAKDTDIYKVLPIASVHPCASQPRKFFSEEQLQELASSIQEKGIIQPLVVRPIGHVSQGKYEIVAGERRWRAAKMLGLETVPTVVREYSDSEAMTIALIENIQRESLNPIEEAEALALLKEQYSLSQEELARNLGKSRSGLANTLRLLNLPQKMRDLVFEGKMSAAHGRTLLALHNEALQEELAQRIISNNLSVRDAENLVVYANANQALPAVRPQLHKEENSFEENPIQNLQDDAPAKKTSRRSLAKPKIFKDLQKELRLVHRGTSISGSMENGKITLPFTGEEELNILLGLFSLAPVIQNLQEENIESAFEESLTFDKTEIENDISEILDDSTHDLSAKSSEVSKDEPL